MVKQNPAENIAEMPVHELSSLIDVPILVMYPRHRAHTALLGLVLDQLDSRVYSYPLQNSDTRLDIMLRNLVTEPQFPNDFGEQTRSALDASDEPEDWAAAFGSDLNKLRGNFVLVLDEMDRLKPDAVSVDRFFMELPRHLPSKAKIVINGRELHRQPWNDLILAGSARAIGDNTVVETGILAQSAERGQVEFQSLSGSSRILSDGRHVKSWDGSLPRNLCYYFIDHPMVTRDEIFEIFWPHLGVKEATNVFHVTKRKISEKIGYEITAYSNGFYVPSPRVNVLYDAREFEKMIEEALTGPEELSPGKWYRAVQLYRHPYLEGLNMAWMVEKREKLRNGFVQALIGLGRMHRALSENERALGYFLRAVSEKPDREDVHRDIMALYYNAGHIDEAVNQYKALEGTLKRKFNITPSQETRALYDLYRSSK